MFDWNVLGQVCVTSVYYDQWGFHSVWLVLVVDLQFKVICLQGHILLAPSLWVSGTCALLQTNRTRQGDRTSGPKFLMTTKKPKRFTLREETYGEGWGHATVELEVFSLLAWQENRPPVLLSQRSKFYQPPEWAWNQIFPSASREHSLAGTLTAASQHLSRGPGEQCQDFWLM